MSDTFKNIKNSTIANRSFNQIEERDTPETVQTSAKSNLADELKQLIKNDQIVLVLEQLLSYFKTHNIPEGLNRSILLSAKLQEITLQRQYDQIDATLFNQEKARIREALLALIDAKL